MKKSILLAIISLGNLVSSQQTTQQKAGREEQ